MTAVGLVGVAGGPAGLALLAGLTAGILVNAATKNVSIVEVSQYAATETMALTSSEKGAAEAQLAGLKKQVVRSALGSHIPVSGS